MVGCRDALNLKKHQECKLGYWKCPPVCWLFGLSVMIFKWSGKFYFHAPVGALVCIVSMFEYVCLGEGDMISLPINAF